MDYTTIEAEIDHGRILVKEPSLLPEQGRGLLILFPSPAGNAASPQLRQRVALPLIKGDGKRIINPSPEELDESAWD